MPSLKQLLAQKEADRARLAAIQEHGRQITKLIDKEEQKLARKRQQKVGALADDAGLTAVSLEVFAEVFTLLAKHGTTDADLRAWLETAQWAMPVDKE